MSTLKQRIARRVKKRPFRAYELTRDADGMPTRLTWCGDYEQVPPVHYLVCPRCRSVRLQDQRCFDCWWQPPLSDPQWRRV